VPSGGAVDDEWRSRGASLLRSVRAVAVRSISAARWGGEALCDYVSRVMKNNTKIQNERAFCKKKREFLPTILRSENFVLKVAKPFVSGHFSQGRKWSEIGRKIFENYSFFSTIHLKTLFGTLLTNSTFQHFNISTNQHFNCLVLK
jgi:hypothetical protein